MSHRHPRPIDVSEVCSVFGNKNGQHGQCTRSPCSLPHHDFARLYTKSKLDALLSALSTAEFEERWRVEIKQVMYGVEQMLNRVNGTNNTLGRLNPNAIPEQSPLQRSVWRVRSKLPEVYINHVACSLMDHTVSGLLAYTHDKKKSERQQIYNNSTALPGLSYSTDSTPSPPSTIREKSYASSAHSIALKARESRHSRYFDEDQQPQAKETSVVLTPDNHTATNDAVKHNLH